MKRSHSFDKKDNSNLSHQIPQAIWVLVFSHLYDHHRIAILPLVSKQFEKVCRCSESWSSTRIESDTLSYRMIFKGATSTRLKKIKFLCISDDFLSEGENGDIEMHKRRGSDMVRFMKQDSDHQMDEILWQPNIICIKSSLRQDMVRFLHRNAPEIIQIQLTNTQFKNPRLENTHSEKELIEAIFLGPSFDKLRSLSFNHTHTLIEDRHLVAIQKVCPSLIKLRFLGPLPEVTRKGFDALMKCPKLDTLALPPSKEFQFSKLIVRLDNLIFRDWDEAQLRSAAWPVQRLKTLSLKKISSLDDMVYYGLRLPETKELKIQQNAITEKEIAHLLETNPTLESLYLVRKCPPLFSKSIFACLNKRSLFKLRFTFYSHSHLCELIVNVRDGLHWSRSLSVVVEAKERMNKFICQKDRDSAEKRTKISHIIVTFAFRKEVDSAEEIPIPKVMHAKWTPLRARFRKGFLFLGSINKFLTFWIKKS